MHADVVAPGAGHVDAVGVLGERKLGVGQARGDAGQALHQRVQVGHHQAHRAAQHLGRAHRQMELAGADIDPGVVHPRGQVRVARQPQTHHVKNNRLLLVGHHHVDMAKLDDVADVLRAAVKRGRGHGRRFCWWLACG